MRYFSDPSVAHDGNPSLSVLALWDLLIAGALAGVSAALYVRTCAPSLLFGDSGEFQFVPYILGIAHPTGYPLYVLLGWLWGHLLPLGNVAYRMNLFSSFWAAMTVGISYLLMQSLIMRTIGERSRILTQTAASIASATFAVSQTFWGQAVIAEVYTLNAFFVVLVLLLFLHWTRAPLHRGRIMVLAFTFGLALTHHRTILALLPGMFVCSLLLRQSGCQATSVSLPRTHVLWREGMIGVVCVLVPSLLYLYLPLRAPHVPYTTLSLSQEQQLVLYENTGQGLLDHITGAIFTENLRLGADLWGTVPSWTTRLAMVTELLRGQFGLVGICLAFLGLARMVWMRQWPWLSLTALSYAVGVLFNLIYVIGDVEVLYIPSYLLVTLWVGIGLVTLAEMVARVGTRWAGYAMLLFSMALPIWLFTQHLPQVDRSSDVTAETMWRPILERPIPSGAVLISNDRDEMMPLWYYQYVEGQRRDLLGLFPRIVNEPSYRDIGGVLDQAIASGRPVFLIKPMPGLEIKVQLEHEEGLAPLVRVVGRAATRLPMHLIDARLDSQVRLMGYNIPTTIARAGDTLALQLYWEPLQSLLHNYTSYVHVVDDQGNLVAQSDHLPGGVYYPTSLWKRGEQLLDAHTITLPSTDRLEIYHLWVGMYCYPTMQPLGSAIRIGSVMVTN